eukprot:6207368-Pleurochrysis_carterae.AAC.1
MRVCARARARRRCSHLEVAVLGCARRDVACALPRAARAPPRRRRQRHEHAHALQADARTRRLGHRPDVALEMRLLFTTDKFAIWQAA